MNLVIVESPAKAKTINKYLGSSYEVLASFGHVRDLPAKNGSVDPDADFQMIWEVDPKAASRLNDIAKALKGADKLILATDPDREGEAISWHVLEVMKQKRALKDQQVERVVFNAITKQSVTDAMKHPRQIDGALVDAYMARRALDYLVGFTLSPVLWRKLPGARSAGRVQSVAIGHDEIIAVVGAQLVEQRLVRGIELARHIDLETVANDQATDVAGGLAVVLQHLIGELLLGFVATGEREPCRGGLEQIRDRHLLDEAFGRGAERRL